MPSPKPTKKPTKKQAAKPTKKPIAKQAPKPAPKPFAKAPTKRPKASRTLAPIPAGLVPPGPDHHITGLRAFGTDGRVMAVHVGLRRVARVETDWLMQSGIREGDEWTPEMAERIHTAAKLHAAYQHALSLMGARQRSAFKLVQKLKQSGHAESDARAAAERLTALGLIDDDSLADRLAEDLARSGKLGQRGIENKLRAKGIDPALAKRTAQAAASELSVPDAALALAAKRAPRLAGLAPQVARRRLYGFLIRRGFEHDEATRATDKALTRDASHDLQ